MALWLANPKVKKYEWKNSSKKNSFPNYERYDMGLNMDSILQIRNINSGVKQFNQGLKQRKEQINKRKSREDKGFF